MATSEAKPASESRIAIKQKGYAALLWKGADAGGVGPMASGGPRGQLGRAGQQPTGKSPTQLGKSKAETTPDGLADKAQHAENTAKLGDSESTSKISGSAANTSTEAQMRSDGRLNTRDRFQTAHEPDTPAFNTKTGKNLDSFVRVTAGDSSKNPIGSWLIPKGEFDAIMKQTNSAVVLKDRYALENVPTHFSEASLPRGTSIRISPAAKNDWGKGGGIQIEVIGPTKRNWFSDLKPLK